MHGSISIFMNVNAVLCFYFCCCCYSLFVETNNQRKRRRREKLVNGIPTQKLVMRTWESRRVRGREEKWNETFLSKKIMNPFLLHFNPRVWDTFWFLVLLIWTWKISLGNHGNLFFFPSDFEHTRVTFIQFPFCSGKEEESGCLSFIPPPLYCEVKSRLVL